MSVLIAILVAFTIFRSPSTALMDVLALDATSRSERSFGQLRAWGTAGYTVATFGAGVMLRDYGTRVIVYTTSALLALTTLFTLALPSVAPPRRVALLPALRVLVRRRRFVLFLLTAALHQLGLGAYDSLFPAYLTHLSDATVAGFSIALGATAEVLFMTFGRRWISRHGAGRVLMVAYAVSSVRWFLLATLRSPAALVAIQLLHAFTFGAFYLAAVALVDDESPSELRASAQGIFSALTWGFASSVGLAISGVVSRHGGMPAVFATACVFSLASTIVAAALGRERVQLSEND
jgi:hypothetical protein